MDNDTVYHVYWYLIHLAIIHFNAGDISDVRFDWFLGRAIKYYKKHRPSLDG